MNSVEALNSYNTALKRHKEVAKKQHPTLQETSKWKIDGWWKKYHHASVNAVDKIVVGNNF